jgi:hypothetical protein
VAAVAVPSRWPGTAETNNMSTSIELAVLGPFRARVDGEDVTHALSRTQRTLLALLAVAWRPVDKLALGHAAGFAASSVDSQLSRLRALLHAPRRLHRGRHPTPGTIDLDPALVETDVARYRALLAGGAEAFDQGDDEAALALLLAADDAWRGEVLEDVEPVRDAPAVALVAPLVDGLVAALRHGRELGARCWLAGARHAGGRLHLPFVDPLSEVPALLAVSAGENRRASRRNGAGSGASARAALGAERLLEWARSLRDSEVCWSAAALAVLARDGVTAARQLAAEWRIAASIERDAAGSARFGELVRLIGSGGPIALHLPEGIAELLGRAEDDHLAGRWDEAERLYLAAADQALADGNLVAEAEAVLAMARLTWDPGRFAGTLDARMARIVDSLPDDETHVQARLYACLAGGLYQDGSAGSDQSVARARQALELVSGLGDPLTAAEVLSRARKALIDVDDPQRQIERSGWILNQAGGSDYHRSLGHLAMIVDSLLLDRVDQARQHTELYREIADRTGSRFHRYHVAALDGLWALHDGRHADVARATARAEALGAAFGGITVVQVVEGQRLWSACERGDHDEIRRLRPLVEQTAGLDQPIPVWELTAAYVAGRLGHHDEAWRRLAAVAATSGDFTALPRGALRIAALGMATLVCADLAVRPTAAGVARGLRAAAEGLRTALLDHPAHGVLIGWPTIYLGPKQRFVDLAAAVAEAATRSPASPPS